MNGRLTAWWRRYRQSTARDVISAVVLTLVLLAGSYGEAHPNQPSDLHPSGHALPYTPDAAFLLVAAAGLVLAARRRFPVPVLAISTAAVVAYSALGFVNGSALLAPAVALFAVANSVTVRRALVIAAVTLVALATATAAGNPFGPTGGGFYLLPALIAVPLFWGITVRNRDAFVISIAEGEAKRRVDEERLRIARELHDVVAHTMATINVQAGVAEHVLAENPAAVGDALRAIKGASKDGLRELRAILNVLRQADEDEPTQPAPGLAQLDALVASATNAGLPTSVSRSGPVVPLPAAADLAAYRIVQESLTNAIRHAGPASATVSLCYRDAALTIEVADTGRSGLPSTVAGVGSGHGLIGMRERAAAVGGTVQAGPGPAGGWRVAAVLPAEQPEAASIEPGRTGTGSRS